MEEGRQSVSTGRQTLVCTPNPCRGSAVLRLATGPLDPATTLRIFDSSGRLVLGSSLDISSSSSPIDFSPLPPGVYVLKVSGAVNGTTVISRLPE
ncbi:T9SS type A sorting domain-containing protein [candidate division WOR-3 bacterium]|nr:T9SS type A sorting domain-containing protein [candidate division WOR-3 bacterium]